ncbi:MAG: hypothetical protein IPP72_21365 [Chitinophagaceae bacterium]|nr:hypothetical protein [Chitinophagaceae bacterium]
MKNQWKELSPLIGLFIAFGNGFLLGKNWLAKNGLDYRVLIIANLMFFIVGIVVYRMQKKAAKNSNPNVFVRSVMGGTMIKMAVCITAILIYAFVFKDIFSKMSVFAAMFLYFIYLIVEVKLATQMNKHKDA